MSAPGGVMNTCAKRKIVEGMIGQGLTNLHRAHGITSSPKGGEL
jgi:hypothetical protein